MIEGFRAALRTHSRDEFTSDQEGSGVLTGQKGRMPRRSDTHENILQDCRNWVMGGVSLIEQCWSEGGLQGDGMVGCLFRVSSKCSWEGEQ